MTSLARCSLADQAPLHAPSGLRVMPCDYMEAVPQRLRYIVDFPIACCPVSKNPREGSTLALLFRPERFTLEVYGLQALLRRFVGGYPGSADGTYPPERNMEGMVQLVCQMCADALAVPVRARAELVLDTGKLRVACRACPRREATW